MSPTDTRIEKEINATGGLEILKKPELLIYKLYQAVDPSKLQGNILLNGVHISGYERVRFAMRNQTGRMKLRPGQSM